MPKVRAKAARAAAKPPTTRSSAANLAPTPFARRN